MPSVIRGNRLFARHAAVLCVSLAAVIAPLGVGGIDLSHPSQSRRLQTVAELQGAMDDCLSGGSPDSCPDLRLGWQPAQPAPLEAAGAAAMKTDPGASEDSQVVAEVSSAEVEEVVYDWPTMEVRPGDTLFGLATWFGVSPWDLAAFNGLDMDGLLFIGQTIWIPISESEFVMPPEQTLFVADVPEDIVEEPLLEPAAALAPVPAPTPAPTLPPYTGTQADVVAAICSLPWPCDQMVRIAYCESGLNPNAVNPAGYYGLFQINYTFDGWNDPWVNSRLAYELKYLPALARGDPLTPWPRCRYS
jgi:LysM repeat protein